jgi:hypothetical protein
MHLTRSGTHALHWRDNVEAKLDLGQCLFAEKRSWRADTTDDLSTARTSYSVVASIMPYMPNSQRFSRRYRLESN